ncbi:ABC transporter [Synechococcus sp. MIT S9220]|nr:ABC transporter [Synechococcus sp. MIT S9220]
MRFNTKRIKRIYPFLGFVTQQPFVLASYGLVAISGCFLIWACVYRVNATVSGIGFTLNQGKNNRAYARVSGRVHKVHIETGQRVIEGQTLISLDNQVQRIEAESNQAIQELSNAMTPKQLSTMMISTEQSIDGLLETQKTLRQQLLLNQEQLRRYQKLVDNQDISQVEYLSQLNQVDVIKTQLLQLKGSIEQKQSDLLQLQLSAKSSQITSDTNADLSDNQLKLSRDILSGTNGIVSVIDVNEGDYVQEGQTVATIALKEGPALGVFLLSAEAAKRLNQGERCFLSPAETPASRYGYILAKVKSVGELPTNPQELTRILGLEYTANSLFDELRNRSTIQEFSAFPYMLVITMDKNKKGDLQWTTQRPPSWGFSTGGAATVDCVYDTWTPISYLVPLMKKNLGYGR